MWLHDRIDIILLVVVVEHATEPGAAEAVRIDIWKDDGSACLASQGYAHCRQGPSLRVRAVNDGLRLSGGVEEAGSRELIVTQARETKFRGRSDLIMSAQP